MATKVEEENLIDLERFSGWKRLLRTTARVVAFACLLLKKTHRATNVAVRRKEDSWRPQKKTQKPTQVAVTPRQEKKRLYVPLEKEHLKKAELLLIRQSQNDSFASEIRNLKAGKPRLDNSSRLKRIDVYIDDDGIIKLRSRTMKFRGEERRKMNPIILDAAVLNERTPPEEVLHTLMTEVEHIVNSRPLTPVSMDPDDEESLTPNHFLLGRSCGAMTPGEFSETDLIGKANWRTSQRLADHFWKRWIREYLPLLMQRKIDGRATSDPKEGDVVMIVDATLPRNSWPRGEVIKTYPGPDGRTRVLDVRTSGGVLRRPTRKIIVLVPGASSRPQEDVLRTAGENVSDDPKL
ncbi:hypothetical protein HF086_011771, partial [Spodoptera exigua]